MTVTRLPADLVMVAVESLEPSPIQPRVNVSVPLVAKLADSMRAGRHDPLLDVEPLPGTPDRYRIVCGEQRWRAAREAGVKEVLVRVHRGLGYLDRLRKQYEENRLRAELDVVEEGHALLLGKCLADTASAQQQLKNALVPFQPLEDKRIRRREEIFEHLEELKRLLVRHKVNVLRTERGPVSGQLSRWSDTEKAFGVSETIRKARVAVVLGCDEEEQERVRQLPAEHATQIARIKDRERRAALIELAPQLTHSQVREAVDRLLSSPALDVEAALAGPESQREPLAFERRLETIADLCRQLARALRNLGDLEPDRREQLCEVIAILDDALATFRVPGLDDK